MTEEKKSIVDTMLLWNQVSRTDVDHTKEVSFGRKFTAIDAHSQIMEATRMFGPIGEGWGYDNVFGLIENPQRGEIFITCDLTLWWTKQGMWEGNELRDRKNKFGPIRGMCALQGVKADGKLKPSDNDAAKKAMTDALTKGLSHLGFNADVFLGMFDDNKYVQDLKKEKDATHKADEKLYQDTRAGFIEKVKECTTSEAMDKVVADYNNWMAGIPAGTAMEMVAWVEKQKKELTDGSK